MLAEGARVAHTRRGSAVWILIIAASFRHTSGAQDKPFLRSCIDGILQGRQASGAVTDSAYIAILKISVDAGGRRSSLSITR